MATNSGLLTNPPWIRSSKLCRRGFYPSWISDKIGTKHIRCLGNNTSHVRDSQASKVQVMVDDAQDPLHMKNCGKMVDHEFGNRNYDYEKYVVRQNFLVRLYELDVHQKASLEVLLNYTEETAANLFQSSGLVVGDFGVCKEMSTQNLIWVMGRIVVEVNSYPSWEDIIQVESWCSALGKLSLTCSSRLTDVNTGKRIMRVDSEFVMINKNTRRVARLAEVIRTRGEPYVRDDVEPLLLTSRNDKLQKLDEQKADYTQIGIKPLWFDVDPNQHVHNAKYISWILEGTPVLVRDNNELAAITLEYRRECKREDVLQSLSVASTEVPQEFDHLLRLENGTEVARARTLWRPRNITY